MWHLSYGSSRVDRRRDDETFLGTVASSNRLIRGGVVEPYLFVKNGDTVSGELGSIGTGTTYTLGTRVLGTGGIVALNRDATSRSIGSEVDVVSTYTVSKELKIQGGLSVFNSGAFLKESIGGGTIWKPYVMWITNF